MTPEEAYEEALRRIRKAEKTGALELALIGPFDGLDVVLVETRARIQYRPFFGHNGLID
jgi:hypothetical protein